MIDLVGARGLVQHDEEAEGEPDDEEEVVAQALDQVKRDRVEHQADTSPE